MLFRSLIALTACVTFHCAGAQTASEAREAQRRSLEEERIFKLKEKSAAEEAHVDAAKPVERKRDARACEAARIAYQGTCGSPAAPRWRNPRCRESEIQLLYAC